MDAGDPLTGRSQEYSRQAGNFFLTASVSDANIIIDMRNRDERRFDWRWIR